MIRTRKTVAVLLLVLLLALLLCGCTDKRGADGAESSAPTTTATPAPELTPEPTETPTSTPLPPTEDIGAGEATVSGDGADLDD